MQSRLLVHKVPFAALASQYPNSHFVSELSPAPRMEYLADVLQCGGVQEAFKAAEVKLCTVLTYCSGYEQDDEDPGDKDGSIFLKRSGEGLDDRSIRITRHPCSSGEWTLSDSMIYQSAIIVDMEEETPFLTYVIVNGPVSAEARNAAFEPSRARLFPVSLQEIADLNIGPDTLARVPVLVAPDVVVSMLKCSLESAAYCKLVLTTDESMLFVPNALIGSYVHFKLHEGLDFRIVAPVILPEIVTRKRKDAKA